MMTEMCDTFEENDGDNVGDTIFKTEWATLGDEKDFFGRIKNQLRNICYQKNLCTEHFLDYEERTTWTKHKNKIQHVPKRMQRKLEHSVLKTSKVKI